MLTKHISTNTEKPKTLFHSVSSTAQKQVWKLCTKYSDKWAAHLHRDHIIIILFLLLLFCLFVFQKQQTVRPFTFFHITSGHGIEKSFACVSAALNNTVLLFQKKQKKKKQNTDWPQQQKNNLNNKHIETT